LAFFLFWNTKSYALCQNIVVVIDPGHGGDAKGGNIDDRIERDINLITSNAMKERLEQYDGVDVYLTRDNNSDPELDRKQRFEIAQSVNADFLFSIHYNMSEYHTLFGSEVWIPSKGINYVKGYQFASIEMDALTGLGLFDRGIKNKLDNDRTGEYYGILKYGEEFNIPSVIIEHCHLDEERDSAFWNNEAYIRFGEIDADCVAKYFGLSSASLGIDNSGFQNIAVEIPSQRVDRDYTEPEYCNIEVIEENDTVTVTVKADDSDNYIQYYSYSLDGGETFSRLEPWDDRSSDTQKFTLNKQVGIDYDIVVKAMNKYDMYLASNIIHINGIEPVTDEIDSTENESISKQEIVENNEQLNNETRVDYSKEAEDIQYDEVIINYKQKSDSLSPIFIFVVTLIVLFTTFNIIFVIWITQKRKRRKRRKRRIRYEDR